MGASGQRLGLRLFLEGIEVPVIAANVQVSINSPATSSIQIVPGDKIMEFKARTMVHLFFWDFTQSFESAFDSTDPQMVASRLGLTVDEAKDIINNHPDQIPLHVSEVSEELRGYKLMFSGEVIGISFAKTPSGRQAVLQCSDFSTYWDTTYQFFVSYGPNGNFMGTSASIWAGSDSKFDDLTEGHVAVLGEYLRNKPLTPGLQNVKGLMAGIISLLETMGGVPEHTHGVNDFFTIGELKNHLLQQIVCEQNDDTSQRLFDDKSFGQWLNNSMSSLGSLCTFRDMMKLLFQFIYYEVVPNPSPMYVPAVKPRTTTSQVKVTTSTTLQLPDSVRDQLNSVGATADHWRSIGKEDTNMQLREADAVVEVKVILVATVNIGQLQGLASDLAARIKGLIPALDGIQPSVKAINGTTEIGGEVYQDVRVTSEVDAAKFQTNRKIWQKVFDTIYGIVGKPTTIENTRNKSVKKTSKAQLDHLPTQIFRPDCFFVAPPKCNVLFPEQYTSFQFARNFLQEVTRLRLHIGWEFGLNEGLLETEFYFAPATKDIKAISRKQGDGSVRGLLPWEIYSGILPKFETMHEVNYVAEQSERRRNINNGSIRGQARDYGQRVANYNYMKYRFAARSCEVSAKFNPFMVCGFPAAIIDRPFTVDPNNPVDRDKLTSVLAAVNKGRESKIAIDDTSDYIRDIAREFGAPTQYVGMVAGLAHNVDQSGGGTSVTLTHCRSHRVTEDDFLGIFSQELSTTAVASKTVATVLDAQDLYNKGDWKKLKFLIDATDQQMGLRLQDLYKKRNQAAGSQPSKSDVQLGDRPTNSPDIANVPGIQSFAGILAVPPPQADFSAAATNSSDTTDTQELTLLGEVQKARSVDGRKVVFVPTHAGVLQSGKRKGPNNGKVVQVQVHSDAAFMLTSSGAALDSNSASLGVLHDKATLSDFTGNRTQKKVPSSDKRYFLWKKVTIYEGGVPGKQTVAKTVPVEEAMRPAWFSPLYSNWFIGDQIYRPFFGTGSIVDQALFQAVDRNNNVNATFGTGRAQQQQLLADLASADGDRIKITQILENAKAKNISDVPDVESALDALAYIYGEIRRLGLDVHKFVHDYTKRPIASMEDMFGSYDLQYEIDGKKLKLVQGTPGFHSSAIDSTAASAGKLLGLLDNPDLPLPRLKTTGKSDVLSPLIDPRPGRREKVQAYLEEINAGSGTLGIGVQG